MFTVTSNTWREHFRAGVAGVNDPASSGETPQAHATRQKVMTEVAGIRTGDRLFFYVQGTKEILGGFRATSAPFFDPEPAFPGAVYVGARFPFRVAFRQAVHYPRPIHVNEIWASRDSGQIWTMQQARGDAVGRHACWPLTRREGNLLEQMLQELNVVTHDPQATPPLPFERQPLPIDIRLAGIQFPRLNYEATLQSLILEGLAESEWQGIFGEFDDFLPFVSTSEAKEIDIVLLKHTPTSEVLWYQLLELKADRYQHEDLLQLLAYETWLTSSQAQGNPRAVHMVAIANRFDEDVLAQVTARQRLRQKPVRLVKYAYDQTSNQLNLTELQISALQAPTEGG